MTGITEHLALLQARIAAAARSAGRDPASVTLLAASKAQPPEAIAAAAAAGVRHFGENYAQEGAAKAGALRAAHPDLTWHFIGRLQSNKTALVADAFDWVQTVTEARLADRLSAQRRFHGPPLQVCIQVAPADAAPGARAGCPADDVAALAAHIAGLARLRLRGLMLLPVAGLDEAGLRSEFRRMAGLLAALRTAGHDVDTLSCGMSDDFELAIAEGSTLVRIGTALFGPRPGAA